MKYQAKVGKFVVEGASGQSENATISEQEMRAILDAQIVDISACLTRIEDIQATADFIE